MLKKKHGQICYFIQILSDDDNTYVKQCSVCILQSF